MYDMRKEKKLVKIQTTIFDFIQIGIDRAKLDRKVSGWKFQIGIKHLKPNPVIHAATT